MSLQIVQAFDDKHLRKLISSLCRIEQTIKGWFYIVGFPEKKLFQIIYLHFLSIMNFILDGNDFDAVIKYQDMTLDNVLYSSLTVF